MNSPNKDSSIDHHHGIGSGSPSSPANPTQENNETQLTPTSTEVEPSQMLPLSPTPPLTSSAGGCEITSDNSIHPPPPPPPPFNLPATGTVGSSSGRKRGRQEYCGGDGESSSSTSQKLPTKCVVCGREFWSEKSYYGHLRKHPDRQWRGAYPPSEVKKLGPTLLELANQTIARMSGSGSGRGPIRFSLGINLNNPPPQSPPPPTTTTRRADEGVLPFDLNMPPPPENEEEDPDRARHPSHSDI